MAAQWLTNLVTEMPQDSFTLVVNLSRTGVKVTQNSDEALDRPPPIYESTADSLIAASRLIAVHKQFIATPITCR